MILVTGAAGTLGRAWRNYLNTESVGIDNSEWAVAADEFCTLGDFAEASLFGIETVIHCAAYKHINLAQDNPIPFIENNVIKTLTLFKRCYEKEIPVLFISTDKAVEPISTYGFTKAIGEEMAKHYGFCVARLPNIMGSSGSVIPVWEKQLEEGKPVTITDPSMIRHFCDVDEAVREIWERYLTGEKLIIPKSTKISVNTLFEKTLEKKGIKQRPLVKIIGLRCREKMVEKLNWDYEVNNG
jgi:FlaA1/EpsC-like NDP-sugar epimerase